MTSRIAAKFHPLEREKKPRKNFSIFIEKVEKNCKMGVEVVEISPGDGE
jgi:hypothetical protein